MKARLNQAGYAEPEEWELWRGNPPPGGASGRNQRYNLARGTHQGSRLLLHYEPEEVFIDRQKHHVLGRDPMQAELDFLRLQFRWREEHDPGARFGSGKMTAFAPPPIPIVSSRPRPASKSIKSKPKITSPKTSTTQSSKSKVSKKKKNPADDLAFNPATQGPDYLAKNYRSDKDRDGGPGGSGGPGSAAHGLIQARS